MFRPRNTILCNYIGVSYPKFEAMDPTAQNITPPRCLHALITLSAFCYVTTSTTVWISTF